MSFKSRFILFCIFVLASFSRFYGLSWDQGFHLHPDERAITMFTTPLAFPNDIFEFLLPTSSWNPHFFAYGNFPLYFLKITGQIMGIFDPLFSQYVQLNLLGRQLSALFDLGTLILIFVLGKKLFNLNVGFLAASFYAISVFPIQASHFYAVDTPLTFFILLTLYQLIKFYEKQSKIQAVLVGLFFGFSLATKNSALVLISSVGIALAIDFLLVFLKKPHRPHVWFPHFPKFLRRLIFDGLIIITTTVITFIILEPYSLLDFKEFWHQTMQQYQMTRDSFTFPYTLQYVGKIPYFYEIKNIFLWGQGPMLAVFSFLGVLYVTYAGMKQLNNRLIIVLVFFWSYFLVVGKFAIGFMRYMLPLYPLFCLFAALFFNKLLELIPKKLYPIRYVLYACLLFAVLWPLSFMHIYTRPNTRVLASDWINQNIPAGKTLAVEHWDDSLPLFGQEKYRMITLPLYDPDTTEKWLMINQMLSQTDYIIIASNRLYVPLQKLTACQKLPPGKCYKKTSDYYKKLFDGTLGFRKIAEFSIYPSLEIGNWKLEIDDSSADESFTVYDHPKVMIFKKILDRESS